MNTFATIVVSRREGARAATTAYLRKASWQEEKDNQQQQQQHDNGFFARWTVKHVAHTRLCGPRTLLSSSRSIFHVKVHRPNESSYLFDQQVQWLWCADRREFESPEEATSVESSPKQETKEEEEEDAKYVDQNDERFIR